MTLRLESGGDHPNGRASTVRWLQVTRDWKVTVSREKLAAERRTRIAELAYRLYEQRDRQDGYALEDWLEAERQVLNQDLWQHFTTVRRLVLVSMSEGARRHT